MYRFPVEEDELTELYDLYFLHPGEIVGTEHEWVSEPSNVFAYLSREWLAALLHNEPAALADLKDAPDSYVARMVNMELFEEDHRNETIISFLLKSTEDEVTFARFAYFPYEVVSADSVKAALFYPDRWVLSEGGGPRSEEYLSFNTLTEAFRDEPNPTLHLTPFLDTDEWEHYDGRPPYRDPKIGDDVSLGLDARWQHQQWKLHPHNLFPNPAKWFTDTGLLTLPQMAENEGLYFKVISLPTE